MDHYGYLNLFNFKLSQRQFKSELNRLYLKKKTYENVKMLKLEGLVIIFGEKCRNVGDMGLFVKKHKKCENVKI